MKFVYIPKKSNEIKPWNRFYKIISVKQSDKAKRTTK